MEIEARVQLTLSKDNDQEQAVYQNQRARMFIEDPRMRDVMQQERDFRARKAKWGRLGWMCKFRG